jgi:hypothetical protein
VGVLTPCVYWADETAFSSRFLCGSANLFGELSHKWKGALATLTGKYSLT